MRRSVQRDACLVVTRKRNHVDSPAAEIDGSDVGGPIADSSGLLDSGGHRGDHLHVGQRLELRVAGDVVAVRMRVNDHEGHRRAVFPGGPFRDQLHDHRRRRNHLVAVGVGLAPGHAGIFEQRHAVAEHQEEKRLLGVDAARLAQDVEVLVVLLHLPVRHRDAVRAAALPSRRHRARLQTETITCLDRRGQRRLRSSRDDRKVWIDDSHRLAAHLLERFVQLEDVRAGQLEDVLFRLIRAAARVVDIRLARLFDVRSEDVGNRVRGDEVHEPLRAGGVGVDLRLRHIEPARIEAVAGHQVAGLPIVEGDAGRVVTRNRNHVDDAASKVDLPE